ncbi:MAG: Trm112 family protein [Alphaproteobacteria bacterium]|jgi:uncharacterized protein|nr:Trm112 family protein [Alphaproteobacteria bacterium]MBT5389610.1 Trm112 family protein [Alphaproteobacteria bacterium]MBT5540174.1 Trm112 family protein [Alphaproteobacteria bacterium]MBT5654854.1 Trm112 family protein [Alphaproteobacteria bacterium]
MVPPKKPTSKPEKKSVKKTVSKNSTESGPQVDPKLLEILVCPVTKQTLVYDRVANELISKSAGLAYPIRNGIPIMLPDEAREL